MNFQQWLAEKRAEADAIGFRDGRCEEWLLSFETAAEGLAFCRALDRIEKELRAV